MRTYVIYDDGDFDCTDAKGEDVFRHRDIFERGSGKEVVRIEETDGRGNITWVRSVDE